MSCGHPIWWDHFRRSVKEMVRENFRKTYGANYFAMQSVLLCCAHLGLFTFVLSPKVSCKQMAFCDKAVYSTRFLICKSSYDVQLWHIPVFL